MHRRTFNELEEEAPPAVTRGALAELLECVAKRARREPVNLLVAPRGFGVTRQLEEIKNSLDNDVSLDTTPASIVAVLDLARNGRCMPIQLLVQLRNEIVKGLDQRLGISDVEYWFLPFDFVAGVAWRRRREDPLDPAFYRSSARRKIGAAGRMVKAAVMADFLEAGSELFGLDEFSKKVGLNEVIQKGAKYMRDVAADKLLERVARTLEEVADGKIIAELKRRNEGAARDLEQYLPLLLRNAISEAFKVKEVDGQIVSGRRKDGRAIELSVIVDTADAYDAPSALGDSVRQFLSFIARDLIEAGFSSIAFGGRSGAERTSLPGWRQSLGEQVGIHELTLPAFRRRELADCLKEQTDFDDERISKLLNAIADESNDAPVHPSAYAESYRLVDTLPKASIAAAARRVLWAAGPRPFTRDDLLKNARRIIVGEDRDDIVTAAWKSQLWTKPYEHERHQLNWHVAASVELAASYSNADPVVQSRT